MRNLGFAYLLASLTIPLVILQPSDARACGGCFHPEDQAPEQASVVTAHRMALAISTKQTVLWDQVEYAGSPDEFAWVLPIRPGGRVEVASDAWFETLEAATNVQVNPPRLSCPNGGGNGFACSPVPVGCSADSSDVYIDSTVQEPDPVTVVHQGSAGPYETVTLHSDVPGALNTWLSDNNFAVDEGMQPILDAYAQAGFDFIALRLLPDAGVQQMKPVRVVQEGAVPTLPLRMVAAGTGANVALTLFVISEGRYRVDNFPEVIVPASSLRWDFDNSRSNYALERDAVLGAGDGRGWLTSFAKPGALLSPVSNPISGGIVQIQTASATSTTIAEAFLQQAIQNGETSSALCLGALRNVADRDDLVVDPCPHGEPFNTSVCAIVPTGQIDARALACPAPVGSDVPLDDLAVALTGMHPKDVWLTRMEANLPREALGEDLDLGASPSQGSVENWVTAELAENPPCPLAGAMLAESTPNRSGGGRTALGLAFLGVGLAGAIGRRLGRGRKLLATH